MNALDEARRDIREARAIQKKSVDAAKRLEKLRVRWLEDAARLWSLKLGLPLDSAPVLAARVSAAMLFDGAAPATGERRSPLISEELATSLARGIFAALTEPAATGAAWLGTTKKALAEAQRFVRTPYLDRYMKHPGSAAGVVLVDVRDCAHFMSKGKLTYESVLARVTGRAP